MKSKLFKNKVWNYNSIKEITTSFILNLIYKNTQNFYESEIKVRRIPNMPTMISSKVNTKICSFENIQK